MPRPRTPEQRIRTQARVLLGIADASRLDHRAALVLLRRFNSDIPADVVDEIFKRVESAPTASLQRRLW